MSLLFDVNNVLLEISQKRKNQRHFQGKTWQLSVVTVIIANIGRCFCSIDNKVDNDYPHCKANKGDNDVANECDETEFLGIFVLVLFNIISDFHRQHDCYQTKDDSTHKYIQDRPW